MSLIVLLILLLVVAGLFGGYGSTRGWGFAGWSPLALIALLFVVLLVTGNVAV